MTERRTDRAGIALVTGATGFLGSHVARLLLERGDHVRVLLRASSSPRLIDELPQERLQRATGDLRDASSLDRSLEGVSTVYHVAADYRLWARDPNEIHASNVIGTKNLLDAARRAGVEKFVYTSTVATMAVPQAGSLPDEHTHTTVDQMIGQYKRTKWLAEQEAFRAASDGLPVVIVNPTTPVGPGDVKPTPSGRVLVDFLNGRMPAYVETGLNYVAVEDAAAGHLLAAERGKPGERYILGAENLTLKQMLDQLAAASGLVAPRWRLPLAVAMMAGYADAAFSRLAGREPRIPLEGVRMARHSMFVATEKARRELGFAPTPVAAALARAVRWFQDNGYVNAGRTIVLAETRAA